MKQDSHFTWSFDHVVYKDLKEKSIELYGYVVSPEDIQFEIYVNHVYVGFDATIEPKIDLENAYSFAITIPLSRDPHDLKVIVKNDHYMEQILDIHQKEIDKMTIHEDIFIHLDKYVYNDENQASGYAYSTRGHNISVKVLDGATEISSSLKRTPRVDLVNNHIVSSKQMDSGFFLTFKGEKNKKYTLVFDDGVSTKEVTIKKEIKPKTIKILAPASIMRVYKYIQTYGIAKPFVYIKERGLKHAIKKFLKDRDDVNYDTWLKGHLPDEETLEKQREHVFDNSPKISLIVATYNTPLTFLKDMIESVENQTYQNFELCIADGSDNEDVKDYIESHHYEKIKYTYLNGNQGISENMNAAMKLATGDYIGFFDHDDLLTPNALYEMVNLINKHPDAQMIYSDEDKVDEEGTHFFNPNFKPDFNFDLLTSVNYICHFLVVKKTVIDTIGAFDQSYDGAQDYDFVLRCVAHLKPEEIYHIPKILYHWRFHEQSTAANAESKTWAFDAGKRALENFYASKGIKATVEMGRAMGLYRTHYEVEGQPLVSIIIPNKDHLEDLKRCIDSLLSATYKAIEIIIVENNSTSPEVFDYYETLTSQYEFIKVVTWEKPFNYSAINNYGESFAKGDYILLLNNDTQVITPNFLEEMLGICQREDVGAVGAQLIYPDHTIQHAGVVLGIEGMAGHVFLNHPQDDLGYFGYIQSVRDYSAVTAACMLVKKSVYDEVGGLSEDLQVAFNDIEFCLRIIHASYRIVYTPYARLYHFESKSRGEENNPEKVKRFNSEVTYLLNKWGDFIMNGDPAYNPNLSLVYKNDYHLKANPDENELEWFLSQHGYHKDS